LSRLRPRLKPLLALVAVVVLAVALSACAHLKSNSLRLSQPAGIGSVKVHFELCTDPGPDESCGPNEEEGQSQYMLALVVPKGSAAPQTITAVPKGAGAPIAFTRNEEVTKALRDLAEEFASENPESEGSYPPDGMESAGYLSSVFDEEKGEIREWLVDLELGLPTAADGGSYGGPFSTGVIFGWRKVDGTHPADRPVDCYEPVGEPPTEYTAGCGESSFAEIGTSDLKIAPPVPASAFVGGKGTIAFPFDFASTVSPPPGFDLTASSSLPKAALTLSSSTFAPGAPDPNTHRSPASAPSIVVAVPKDAKPGTYEVTLTATTGAGGSVSQVATLKVTKPKIKLGGVKLNKAKGTATLSVKVPAAGTLTASGKGIVKAKKKAKKAKRLKVTIKPKGKTKSLLAEEGKARVKAKIVFKPTSGIAVVKSKSITLKQS
jgi:hypothetical protein